MHGGSGDQDFFKDWVLPQVMLNGAIMMWLMVKQENNIPEQKLLKYQHFNNLKGVGFERYLRNLKNVKGARKMTDTQKENRRWKELSLSLM